MKKIGWEGSTGRLSLVVVRKKNVPEIFCFAHSADDYLHLIKVLSFNQEALCCFSTLVSVATQAGFLPTSFNGILARQSQREGSVPLDPKKED